MAAGALRPPDRTAAPVPAGGQQVRAPGRASGGGADRAGAPSPPPLSASVLRGKMEADTQTDDRGGGAGGSDRVKTTQGGEDIL